MKEQCRSCGDSSCDTSRARGMPHASAPVTSALAIGCWLRSTRGLSLPLATLTCGAAVETNPPYSLVLTSCHALCLAIYRITIGVALTACP